MSFCPTSDELTATGLLFPCGRDRSRSLLAWHLLAFCQHCEIKEKLDRARFFQIRFVLFLKESLGHLPSNLGSQTLRRQRGPSCLQIINLVTPEKVPRTQASGWGKALPAHLSFLFACSPQETRDNIKWARELNNSNWPNLSLLLH